MTPGSRLQLCLICFTPASSRFAARRVNWESPKIRGRLILPV